MFDLKDREAKLLAEYHAKLAKARREAELFGALSAIGLPEPSFSCVHDRFVSVSFAPEGISAKHSVEDALGIVEAAEPHIVPMEPARDGVSLSLYPTEARSKPERWKADGVPFAVELYSHAYGAEHEPGTKIGRCRYHDTELRFWIKAGDHLIHCGIKIPHPRVPRAYVDSGGRFVAPEIRPARKVSFWAERPAFDLHYLFATVADCKSALIEEPMK